MAAAPTTLELTNDNVPKVWEKLKQDVGPLLAAQLRQLPDLPAISGPNALAIRVPAGYTAVYENLRAERTLDVLRIALRRSLGRDVAVVVELLAAKSLTSTAAPAAPPPNATQSRRREMLELPFLKNAVGILGAQLMKAEDGFDPLAEPIAAPTPAAVVPEDDETPETPPPPDPD